MIGGAMRVKIVIARLVTVILVVSVSRVGSTVTNSTSDCDAVQNFFRMKDIVAVGIRAPQISAGNVCGTTSCCNSALEEKFLNKSRTNVDGFVKESLLRLSTILETRAKRFDEFFRELMENSKKEFHEMFKRTYGVIYLQNSFVFTDFFQELENYYATGRNRLSDVLDQFFGLLYQRMFVVINGQYTFSEDYLQCVNEHMVELGPFGDVPHKLGVQLRRAFVATRAFHRALVVGADVVKKAAYAYPGADAECAASMTRMKYCATCQGYIPPPATCSAFCIHTLKYCMKTLDVLDKQWDLYVDALDKVGDRLLGPFNIEMVVEPINIKISEAVMNFQENGAEVSQRVFTGCGKPVVNRRRRDVKSFENTTSENITISSNSSVEVNNNNSTATSTSTTEITLQTLKFNNDNNSSNNGKKKRKKVMESTTESGNEPSLDKLIKDIKQKVKDSRRFWTHLPYQFCNSEQDIAGPSVNATCWNGTAIGPFSATETNVRPPYSEIQNLPFTLQTIVTKLQAAFQGQDVDLADEDAEEPILQESGSGSGDYDDLEIEGSGYQPVNPGVTEKVPSGVTQPPEPPPPIIPKEDESNVYTPKVTASAASLHKTLLHFLLPLVFAWFGGLLSDLLQL
ncbi:glypican-6 isoform X2 [Agrilus planipennis]|uniref:Glypican-6 isoform X2 n=1 Tax=Agrilus planipennis TaxID=224129 RepID=A0A1W4XDA3_AGRPL|nr:glypican-6 isoform X2 [Agrilus planipennis]